MRVRWGWAWGALAVGIGLCAFWLGFGFIEQKLVYPAPFPNTRFNYAPFDKLELRTEQGAPVNALYTPAESGRPVLVIFHGNGDQLSRLMEAMPSFLRARYGVMLVEYPGYGLSRRQSPSEQALYQHAQVALTHLIGHLRVTKERVVLVGESLGSGVAVEMARRDLGGKLVLLSPFTSLPAVGKYHAPWVSVSWFRNKFDSLAKAPALKLPVLILHGTLDGVIPIQMGQRLAEAISESRFVALPGIGHGHLLGKHRQMLLTHMAHDFAPKSR